MDAERHVYVPSLEAEPCLVLDVESADSHDPVIEMAVVALRSGAVCLHCRFGMPPGAVWNPFAAQKHQIPQRDLAGLPTFASQSRAVADLLAGRIIIGHTIASDMALITTSLAPGVQPGHQRTVCTRMLAQRYCTLSRSTLGAVATAFGVPRTHAHSALADTQATRLVYLALRDQVQRQRFGEDT